MNAYCENVYFGNKEEILTRKKEGTKKMQAMAGGTHVFDMIKRLKENEGLRKLNYFKRKDSYKVKSKPTDDDFKATTKEDLEKIIREAKDERVRENRKAIKALFISVLVTGALILLLLKLVNP